MTEFAMKNAVKLGSTISDLISATATFARLGYSLPEATDLGQVATVYKNVADGIENIDDASSILVSTMKAFNIQASESMSIADKLNEVGNKYAIGSAQLGDALQRSASALAAAGNDIDQSIGLITSAYEIIQNSEIVGTSLKTISMRLRNTSGSLEEMGEDSEGAAESITKLQQQIKKLSGVDIMLDPSTFKSTYDIIVELSKVWGNLSDIAQADLTRLIAGNYILVKCPVYAEMRTVRIDLNPVKPKAHSLQCEMKYAA